MPRGCSPGTLHRVTVMIDDLPTVTSHALLAPADPTPQA
jgi:hypothetical protein